MDTETLLIIFVGLTALAMVIQCAALWSSARSVRSLSLQLKQQSADLERRLSDAQSRLLEVSEQLQPLGEVAENIRRNVDEVSGTIQTRAEDIDRLLSEITQLGREQASKVDFLVTDTIQKFEETTESIQKDVLRPAVEIAAFAKGMKAGIDVLFARKAKDPAHSTQEEELFI